MAMSHQQLAQIIGNSRALCSEAGNKLIRSKMNTDIRNNISAGLSDVDPSKVSDQWDNFSLNEGTIDESTMTYTPASNYTNQQVMNSKLPDAIKESFMKQKIEQPNAMNAVAAMVEQTTTVPRQRLVETTMQTAPIPQGNALDYNYLKYIISECISDYFTKNPIQSGSGLKQINLVGGKIKLVDNDGNIYAAQLERIGNIKDKKK